MYENSTIGETAKVTGLSIRTIRYYEDVGILSDIIRNQSGQRIFTDFDIHWLIFTKYLRETGMSIKEIVKYKVLVDLGDETINERIQILERQKQKAIQAILEKQEQIKQIDHKIANYKNNNMV